MLFARFYPSTGASVTLQNRLRAEVVRLKRELNGTSSQDEFAKWAKLRRQHDKAVTQYEEICRDDISISRSHRYSYTLHEVPKFRVLHAADFLPLRCKIASSLQSFRSTFDKVVTATRWLGTNGLRVFLQWWFAKRPMFWLPQGWVPGYVEWLLAFPRAPTGSVSIQMWGIACATVVQLVGAAIVATYVLVTAGKEKGTRKVAVPARPGGREDKKEL